MGRKYVYEIYRYDLDSDGVLDCYVWKYGHHSLDWNWTYYFWIESKTCFILGLDLNKDGNYDVMYYDNDRDGCMESVDYFGNDPGAIYRELQRGANHKLRTRTQNDNVRYGWN